MRKSDSYKQRVIDVELVNGDNLYEWDVKLYFTDKNSPLHKELKRLKQEGRDGNYILLRVTFKHDFPHSPPFVRILKPQMTTNNIVQEGGFICIDILSPQNWNKDYTMEGVFLSIIHILVAKKLRIHEDQDSTTYTLEKALKSFEMVEDVHRKMGWEGFDKW